MERYHIRVDKISDRTLEFLDSWIKKHSIKTYLISEEEGTQTGKIHYQGFVDIDTSIRNEKAWRTNLKDHIHTTGRNQYSLTIKHGNLEKYILKDGKIVLQSEDIHPLQVESWKAESYKKKDKDGNSTFTSRYLQAMGTIPGEKDKETLTLETIRYFKDNSKIFDKFIIRRFVNLAIVHFGDEKVLTRMARFIWDD